MSHTYTVGQINSYIKNMFASDFFLQKIEVEGEVSNCKYHSSGHIYFSLKDASGTLSCVMFARERREGLGFVMKDGDKVVVTGSVNVFVRDGRYQLYASRIRQDGLGALYERFLRLKQELEEMGMFDASYKKPIPSMVRRLGVVTAPAGAAIQDIRNVAMRRNPYLQIILCPALVQGRDAAPSLVRALALLDQAGVDVIIIGRGGGSLEDLWAFNEESVARAVFACRTPVISAVGHETDYTITDFVADLRAPTPSAAAELAVQDVSALLRSLNGYRNRLQAAAQSRLRLYQSRLSKDRLRLGYLSPKSRLRERRQMLDDEQDRLLRTMQGKLKDLRAKTGLLAQRIQGLSPLEKLKQGYAYLSDRSGRAVYRLDQVHAGQELTIYVTDGSFRAEVTDTEGAMENGRK